MHFQHTDPLKNMPPQQAFPRQALLQLIKTALQKQYYDSVLS